MTYFLENGGVLWKVIEQERVKVLSTGRVIMIISTRQLFENF